MGIYREIVLSGKMLVHQLLIIQPTCFADNFKIRMKSNFADYLTLILTTCNSARGNPSVHIFTNKIDSFCLRKWALLFDQWALHESRVENPLNRWRNFWRHYNNPGKGNDFSSVREIKKNLFNFFRIVCESKSHPIRPLAPGQTKVSHPSQ